MGPVEWNALCSMSAEQEIGHHRFQENVGREKLLRLMNKCRENADKEPFYTKPEVPSAAYVGGLRFPERVTGGGEMLFDSEQQRQDDKWILLKPLWDKQIGDSMKVCDLFVRT